MAPLTKNLRLSNLWYLHVSSVRIAHDDLTMATSMLPLPVARTHNAFAGRDHPTPPPLVVDGNPEYVVKRTIHTKYSRVRRKCRLLVHIRWLVPRSQTTIGLHLSSAFDDDAGKPIADAYHEQHPAKPGPERLAKDLE